MTQSFGFRQAYATKSASYFDGARTDMVEKLPNNPQGRILEIGCGYGGTGQLALNQGKCKEYIGVEISGDAAKIAKTRITDVVVGNAEELVLSWPAGHFDALIMSEVLEHLVDPWALLRRIRPLLKDNATVLASSPNISQYLIILELIGGRWDLADSGPKDRTHLRWFTPDSYRDMFEETGFVVEKVQPLVPFSAKTRFVNFLTGNRFRHLFMRQIFLSGKAGAKWSATQ